MALKPWHRIGSGHGGMRLEERHLEQVRADASAFRGACERVHREWHDRARSRDAEGLLALYAQDATLESPLVPVVLDGMDSGVLHGRSEIHRFLTEGAQRLTKNLTHWHRTDAWMTDGERLLVWEYPHVTPNGAQLDIVEVMELANGLIQHHRIYWGWFGSSLLARNAQGETCL